MVTAASSTTQVSNKCSIGVLGGVSEHVYDRDAHPMATSGRARQEHARLFEKAAEDVLREPSEGIAPRL